MSYNCKGFGISKVPYVCDLLQQCDAYSRGMVISSQFTLFKTYFRNWEPHSICGMDELTIQGGQPSGRGYNSVS